MPPVPAAFVSPSYDVDLVGSQPLVDKPIKTTLLLPFTALVWDTNVQPGMATDVGYVTAGDIDGELIWVSGASVPEHRYYLQNDPFGQLPPLPPSPGSYSTTLRSEWTSEATSTTTLIRPPPGPMDLLRGRIRATCLPTQQGIGVQRRLCRRARRATHRQVRQAGPADQARRHSQVLHGEVAQRLRFDGDDVIAAPITEREQAREILESDGLDRLASRTSEASRSPCLPALIPSQFPPVFLPKRRHMRQFA